MDQNAQSPPVHHDLDELRKAAVWFRAWWIDGASRYQRAELRVKSDSKKAA